jgi:hypothetical protein
LTDSFIQQKGYVRQVTLGSQAVRDPGLEAYFFLGSLRQREKQVGAASGNHGDWMVKPLLNKKEKSAMCGSQISRDIGAKRIAYAKALRYGNSLLGNRWWLEVKSSDCMWKKI